MARRVTLQPVASRPLLAAAGIAAVCALGIGTAPAAAQTSPVEILPPRSTAPPHVRKPRETLRPTLDEEAFRNPDEPVLRPAAKDGDVSQPPEPAIREGTLDSREMQEQPAVDPPDTVAEDARPPAEAALFESPPDTQLFQIEDLQPLADRRVAALFRNDPYAPIGYRIGSFVLFPQLELAGVGFSNVLRAPQARADRAFELRPEARLVSNWRWHALELRARGRFDFHDELPSENDRNTFLEARGRIDLTRRSNLQALVSREVVQEPRSGPGATTSRERADLTTTQAAASFNQRFNRVSLQLRAGIAETEAGKAPDETGTPVVERARNLTQTEQAARIRYDLKSSFGVFGETALVQRRYEAAPSDGLRRDSNGERYRLGLVYLPDNTRLRGEASIGWGRQNPDSPALSTVDGFLLDANLVWRMTPLTSMLLTARSDIVDSLNENVSGVLSRTAGIELRHLVRRYLTASAGLELTRYDYRGSSLEEKETTARLALEYALSREIQLFTRYDHIWLESSAAGGDWQADEVRVGMRLRH